MAERAAEFIRGFMDLIRILFADDHRLFRAGLGALLDSVTGLSAVGEATTGAEAIRQE